MGESDPDAFWALDFDDMSLDYFLLTSELPAYNQKSHYTYENTNSISNIYNWYYANTLGNLETAVRKASENQLDAIRATCIDGRPQYEFINSTAYDAILPQSILFRPIVLSQDRYDDFNPQSGHLVITTECSYHDEYSFTTEGINAYSLNAIETKAGYKSKVPINDKGFEYPIQYISIDIIRDHPHEGVNYLTQDLIVDESQFAIDSGNLYFTSPLDTIIVNQYPSFYNALQQADSETSVYYKIHVVFDVFVADTTVETNKLALAQATYYTIMDYFNQYTYAETTAQMISEIAYTEIMTFWSTLISAPLVLLGSWTIMGTSAMM